MGEVEEWEEEAEEAASLEEEEAEEEEGPQEASAVPTPTLHLPSLSHAGAVVKAKVRTVTWAQLHGSHSY